MKGKSEKSQLHSGGKVDIELLGQIDFQPNIYNEKVISMDIDKILYYIGLGVSVSTEVGEILGIFGYLPVHPSTELRLMKFHETRRYVSKRIFFKAFPEKFGYQILVSSFSIAIFLQKYGSR